MRRKAMAFTLIELLAVMAVLSILAGLFFVGVTRARLDARKRRAESELAALSDAWKQYYLTYGSWPAGYNGQEREMTFANMAPLLGQNQHGIRFMELAAGQDFKDPWGQLYRMVFTAEAHNMIDRHSITVQMSNRKRYAYEQ